MFEGFKYKSLGILSLLDEKELKNIKKVMHSNPGKWPLQLVRKKELSTKNKRALSVNQRNHLRLLLHRMQHTLAITSLQRQAEWEPYFYLSELLQRNAFSQFDKEFKKHFKNLQKSGFTLHCLLMKDLELERLVIEAVFTRQSVQRINTVLAETASLLKEYQDNFTWRMESYKVFLKAYHDTITPMPAKDLPKPVNAWQKVYALRHQLHGTNNIGEKIVFLKQLYKLTSRQNGRLFQRETATTCSNLATYYMIQGKFDLSLEYFNRALELRKYFRPANYLMLQFNYVGLSLRNLQFDTAYQVMLDVDDSIQRLPAVAFKWKLLKCMCYVLAGKEKEVKNILPAVPNKKDPRDYIYFYAIWAIYFTHMGKSETALQMTATARSLSRRHKADPGLLAFAVVLHKHHLYLRKYSAGTAAVKTLILFKKIDLKSLSAGNILPLIWFEKYLEKETKQQR